MNIVYEPTPHECNELCKRYGHLNRESYAHFFHIASSTAEVTSHIASRNCGVPDFANGPAEAQWPTSCMKVPCHYNFDGLNLSSSVIADAWEQALAKWEETCGIKLPLVPTKAEAKIWATDGPLPGSTLAWSFLANNSCAANLEQRYDTLPL